MVGVAVVGAGAWGKNHIRVFSEIPNVRLKYICDQDSSKLESMQKSFPESKGSGLFRPCPGRPGGQRGCHCILRHFSCPSG